MVAVRRACRVSLAIALLLAGASGVLVAGSIDQPPRKQAIITFIPERSRIAFTLRGFPHVTHGTFRLTSGIVRVAIATERIDGEIVIDARSAFTGGGMRDREMKNSVLEADRYPRISYAPQKIESHGEPHDKFPVRVLGLMLIHGAAHRFLIDATVTVHGDEVIVASRFTVPYVAWGLEDPSIFVFRVDKTVDVDATLAGRVTWAEPRIAGSSAAR